MCSVLTATLSLKARSHCNLSYLLSRSSFSSYAKSAMCKALHLHVYLFLIKKDKIFDGAKRR